MTNNLYNEVSNLIEIIEKTFTQNVDLSSTQGVFSVEDSEDMFLEPEEQSPFINYLNDARDYLGTHNYDDCLEQLKFAKKELNASKTLTNVVVDDMKENLTNVQNKLYRLRNKKVTS